MYLRIIILFLIFFSNTIAEEISGIPKIVDGDTVHINENKFRLEGIDAPEMRQKCKFVKITGAGLKESHVHDVQITRESPNYRII